MSRILVSGLVNVETTVHVPAFPIPYYPINYPFFGVHTAVSGVARNIAGALHALGDTAALCSMTGKDTSAGLIRGELDAMGISCAEILPLLGQTPASAVLYDDSGRRQIHCDLKDIQEQAYPFRPEHLDGCDIIAACNINFSRPLLSLAKAAGKPIATDVHILSDPDDAYNREFMAAADILFLSDEGLWDTPETCLWRLAERYDTPLIALGRGSEGAMLFHREEQRIYSLPAAHVGPVVNTVGAGDALFSAFLHYYSKKFHPAEALLRAQLFAAAKIRCSGGAAGFVDEETVEELYRRHGDALKCWW